MKVNHRDLTCLGPLAVDFAGKRELVFLFHTVIPHTSVDVILFRHARLLAYHAPLFLFFSQCVSSYIALSQRMYDIIHVNDWHTALIPVLLGENNKARKGKSTLQSKAVKTVLTIHNLLYQGSFPLHVISDIDLLKSIIHPVMGLSGKREVNVFREGLERADSITTVSPSYAREIITPAFGPHVYDILRKRSDKVVGILNGIDSGIWNPKIDEHLSKNYSVVDVFKGKAENKKRLQKAVGLPQTDELLFGFVGRIEPRQKGVDLIIEAIRRMPDKKFQVVLLGTGDSKQVKELETIDKNCDYIAYISTFDERLARRIFAGSDVMLVPSKFEPCGLTQMIAMRYGTIPLVRKTGGLADSVIDGKTGFVFDEYNVEYLCKAMWKAIVLMEDKPKDWQAMVRRVMRQDFSWRASAREYKALYTKLLSPRQ
jgi:starch synthase